MVLYMVLMTCVCVAGFKRKEFRGKLAIAITANFINTNSQAEVTTTLCLF